MKLYRLNITPSDTAGEGENWDEWFTSFAIAKKERQQYITREPDYSYCGENYSIDVVEIPNLPKKQLLLKALNCKGSFPSNEVIKAKAENRP